MRYEPADGKHQAVHWYSSLEAYMGVPFISEQTLIERLMFEIRYRVPLQQQTYDSFLAGLFTNP